MQRWAGLPESLTTSGGVQIPLYREREQEKMK